MATRWLALLRGINVGGHNRLPMADLRRAIEAVGGFEIATYIQSGNVVFSGPSDLTAVQVRGRIAHLCNVDVPVVLIDKVAFEKAEAKNPFPTDDGKALHLFALWDELDDATVAALNGATRNRDAWDTWGQFVYVFCPDGFGRSKLAEAASKKLSGTGRNWNTVERLSSML